MSLPKVLLIGFGNPGRLDDGLGPAFAESIEKMNIENVTVDADYQLTVEDAANVSQYDIVIFADASVNGKEPFFFEVLEPVSAVSFSSHSIDPENVLALADEMFGKKVKGYVLGIRGYEYNEFGEHISEKAQQNLALALNFTGNVLQKGNFDEVAQKPEKKTENKSYD